MEATTMSRQDRGPRLVVWGLWLAMVVIVLDYVARFARNIPLAEDWLMVPPLAGLEPDFWEWVWAQNNEHRLPLPRLVYLGLLELTGDFRVGAVVNALVLAALAAAMILVARRVRGGRTRYVDALFPLAVLHIGHTENLLWSWELSFVLSAAAVVAVLLVLVAARMPLGAGPAFAIGVLLVALPLTGAYGLPYVAALAVGVAALVWTGRPLGLPGGAGRRATVILPVLAGVAVVVSALYFVGYERPSWTPDNPGVGPTLETTGRFAAMGLGSAYNRWSGLLVAVIVASALVVLAHRLLRGRRDVEFRRAAILAAFLAGSLLLDLAVGYGRAALVPESGMADRYAILSLPGLVGAWFAWQLYGPPRARTIAQGALLAAAVVLLPANVERGEGWRDWYVAGAAAVDRDIDAGLGRDELVRRNGTYLLHWDDRRLAWGIDILQDEGIGPFARLREEPRAAR